MAENPPEIDPVLQVFIRIMHRADVQLSITVLVGGSWLSGTLIPPRMYMEELAAHIGRLAGKQGEAVGTFFTTIGRIAFPAEAEIEAGIAEPPPDDDEVGPWHFHLRDARTVTPSGSVPTARCYLRIRLADVAAWSIGEFSAPGYRSPPPPKLGT
jgi:hypothetical protein